MKGVRKTYDVALIDKLDLKDLTQCSVKEIAYEEGEYAGLIDIKLTT